MKLFNKKKDLMNVLDIGEVLDKMIIQEDIKKSGFPDFSLIIQDINSCNHVKNMLQ